MSHLSAVGRRHWKSRLYVGFLYSTLALMGLTMVVPFLITISGSATGPYDYNRFRPIPRFLTSRTDRYMKGLVKYFNGYRDWDSQLRAYFPESPDTWTSWVRIGEDIETVDALAAERLRALRESPDILRLIAADYAAFTGGYPMSDTQVAVEQSESITFLREQYRQRVEDSLPEETFDSLSREDIHLRSLAALSETWGAPVPTFYVIRFDAEMRYPLDFQTWTPPVGDPKYQDFLDLKAAYRNQRFLPGMEPAWKSHARGLNPEPVFPVPADSSGPLREAWRAFQAQQAPASMAVPFALRAAWIKFLTQDERVRELADLSAGQLFDVTVYNRMAETDYRDLRLTPFPVPDRFAPGIQRIWEAFLRNRYPLRLTTIRVDDDMREAYARFLEQEMKVLRVANELLGTEHSAWNEFQLSPDPPGGDRDADRNRRSIWMNFVKSVPIEAREYSSSEIAYQRFLLERYESVEAVNRAYGWDLRYIEEAFPPLATAYTVTFDTFERAFTLNPTLGNYRLIFDFLVRKGNAIFVTLMLVSLTILATLTVNPLCAYSLSRFPLPGKQKLLLFLLATMAFPAMVSAIPAYLLMRDLNLLNTFFALVLPGAANGMAIFILKGFFDSLPRELFEAATIDGASETQIFRIVAMPMVKPILAINSISAFIAAYNGWQWALIICQDPDMWTLAVWMYQATQWWKTMPWVVSAGFVIISIPTMVVFLSCQKIILKGIAIPSMK